MELIAIQVNTIGKAFVGLALPMLLESAVVIGLVLLVEFALRERLRAGLRYWLVTCVLAFLVLLPLLALDPPSTHWPAGKGSSNAIFHVWEPKAAYADPTSSLPARHTNAPLSQPTTGQSGSPPAAQREWEPSQTTTVGVGERPRTLTWQGAVFVLWLAGAGIMGVVLVRRALAACKRIDKSPAANHLMNDILLYCRKRMGIRGPIRLKVGHAGMKPAVCGLLRPVIIVPRNLAPTLGSRHLRDVLFHELAHVKRHDLWVNLAQNVLQVLYFYNPLLFVVNAAIRRLREEAADETVLETIGDADHSYAKRLTDVASITLQQAPPNFHLIGVA